MTTSVVGMVGLGIMGTALYGNLLEAGFEVVGYDLVPEKVSALEEAGGSGADSAAVVASRADVLVTSLDDPDALAQVVAGPDGIMQADDRDLVVVETSTLAVETKLQAKDRLAETGIEMLDCAISGTGLQAVDGDIALYASGDSHTIQRCRPVFEAVARSTHDVGEFGNGSRMKYVANHLVAVHNLAAAEALLLAEASGLDLATVVEVIRAGAGTSRMWEIRGPEMIAESRGRPAARIGMFMKDLDIIGRHAVQVEAPAPLFSAALSYYTAAMAQGLGDQDAAALIDVLRRLASASADAA